LTIFAGTFNTGIYVQAGGLMSYEPNFPDLFWRAADFVDKILRGARPGDIRVEQATKFDLVINLTTAKALGLSLPPSLLADETIEKTFRTASIDGGELMLRVTSDRFATAARLPLYPRKRKFRCGAPGDALGQFRASPADVTTSQTSNLRHGIV
jgi:hypothetical protein